MPVQAGPPPIFPPLLSKPLKLKSTPDLDYKILWNEEFMLSMRDSPYYLSKDNNNGQSTGKPKFIYSHMPAELRPNYIKKSKADSTGGTAPLKKKKVVDLDTRLKILEEKELKIKKEPGEVKEEPESEDEEEQIEEDPMDEEMDEENDYGNNYFDNGEAFNEEDDNLDDGPIY